MASLSLWPSFEIFTNNCACSWLLHHPKVSPKLARYLTIFAQYTFTIHHIHGALNVVADALSRRPDATGSLLFGKQDGLLFLRTSNKLTRLCIPNNNRLQTKVISDYHDSQIAAHPGNRRSFLRVAKWYYWNNCKNTSKNTSNVRKLYALKA